MHILISHNWKKTSIIKLAAVLFIAFLITSCESESEVSIVNNSNDELSIVLYRPNSIYDTANFSITSKGNKLKPYNKDLKEYLKSKIDSSLIGGEPLIISFEIKPKSTIVLYRYFNGKSTLNREGIGGNQLSVSDIADKLIIRLKNGGSIVADKEGVDKLFNHYEKSFLGGREAFRLVIN